MSDADEATARRLIASSGLDSHEEEGESGLVGMETAFITECSQQEQQQKKLQQQQEEEEAATVPHTELDVVREVTEDLPEEEEEEGVQPYEASEEEEEETQQPEPEPVAREATLESLLMNDELWDTDLEDEFPEDEEEDELHDTTGRVAYRRACERLGAVPVKYFMQHLCDTELVMRYHGLGPIGTRALAKPLANNVTIVCLDLRGNWMEAEGGAAIGRMLEENSFITQLDLGDNQLGDAGFAGVCAGLRNNSSVVELSLAANGIGETSAQLLHDLLVDNKSLVSLDLSKNLLGQECGSKLGLAIAANEYLEQLDLSSNCIVGRGAVELANGLKESFRLKVCSLAWNGFAEEGGLAVAEMLRHNQMLSDLNLQGNRLTSKAAVAIGNAVATNESLQRLHLGNNFLFTPALVHIVTAIVSSELTPLTFLSFKDIPVDFEFVKIVEKQLAGTAREFHCEHGPVLRAGNTREELDKAAIDIRSPIVLLKEHILVNDFRFVQRLAELDSQGTKTVTIDQFASVLDEMHIPYYRSQLLEIQRRLDRLGDGTVYFGDFLPQTMPRRESAIIRSRGAIEAQAEIQVEQGHH